MGIVDDTLRGATLSLLREHERVQMGMTLATLRLANDARADLEEIDAEALVDTGALHLCIPEHVALQLQLKDSGVREV